MGRIWFERSLAYWLVDSLAISLLAIVDMILILSIIDKFVSKLPPAVLFAAADASLVTLFEAEMNVLVCPIPIAFTLYLAKSGYNESNLARIYSICGCSTINLFILF